MITAGERINPDIPEPYATEERAQKIRDGLGEILSPLRNIPTCKLVEELKCRQGTDVKTAEPYQDIEVKVNGPAVVLVVTD